MTLINRSEIIETNLLQIYFEKSVIPAQLIKLNQSKADYHD